MAGQLGELPLRSARFLIPETRIKNTEETIFKVQFERIQIFSDIYMGNKIFITLANISKYFDGQQKYNIFIILANIYRYFTGDKNKLFMILAYRWITIDGNGI